MAHELLHIFGAWDMYETFRYESTNGCRKQTLSELGHAPYELQPLRVDHRPSHRLADWMV